MDVFFKNDKKLVLAGRIEFPEKKAESYPIVVFAHGFDSGKDSPRGVVVADHLRKRGIATLLFDFTGHGESQGVKTDSTIDQQVDDLISAIDCAAGNPRIDAGRIGVCGASSGGLVALQEALMDQRVKVLGLRGPRTDGLAQKAPEFRVPVLIVQGELDPLLPQSEAFVQALDCPKELAIIAGADHLFSRSDQLEQVVNVTANWFFEKMIGGRDTRIAA